MILDAQIIGDEEMNEFKQEFLNDIETNTSSSPGLQDAIENLKIINKIYKNSGYDYNT